MSNIHIAPKEMMVLHELIKGASNKMIAKALGNSEQTIKNYVSVLLLKFDAGNRTELAIKAVGLLDHDTEDNNHKGEQCQYEAVLCQEGFCSECWIPRLSEVKNGKMEKRNS